jgi:hypothetical protein
VTLAPILGALALLSAGHAARPSVPAFEHVAVVVFENKEASQILESSAAPTFNAFAKRYARLTRYYAVSHPSLPNYLALVSGSTHGIRTDCVDCRVTGRSLADTLEAVGRTWKLYAEDLPSPGYTGPYSAGYAKKHNPFVYFDNVVSSPARLERVVPLTQLRADLGAGTLPNFAFVVPNSCNSMHDCGVAVGDQWLKRTITPLLRVPKTVVFVVFDEGMTALRGGGHIAALALGTAVRVHSRFAALTSHYGLLRTIEAAWKLPLLGRSARARPITGIWR